MAGWLRHAPVPDRSGAPSRRAFEGLWSFFPHLRLFEKRFCRPKDGSARLFGYNESPFLTVIGPGSFVGVSTAPNPAWAERGAVVIDYFQVPDGTVATGWPPVVPNTKGLQRFAYNKTRDFMRKERARRRGRFSN